MDQFGIRLLCPALGGWIKLVREDAHGNWNLDAFDIEKTEFTPVLPIETGAGYARVRQPSDRDIVEDVVASEAFGSTRKNARDHLVTARVMIEEVARQTDWGIRDSVQRLGPKSHLEPVGNPLLIYELQMFVGNLLVG